MINKFVKRFLLLLLPVVVFYGAAYSEEVITPDLTLPAPVVQSDSLIPPKWEEFCEPGYEHASVSSRKDLFSYISFVKTERDKKNYWANRRESFEKYLKYCRTMKDDTERAGCYSELRAIETDKNDVYNSKRRQILYQNATMIKNGANE